MLDKTKNIETTFQHIRLFGIVLVVACLSTSGFIAWWAFRAVERAQEKIYVLNSGKVLEALGSDRKENIPAEAKDHIRAFHQLFFTLSPDEQMINLNLSHALYLADGSAKRLYDNLKETGYYAGLISGNISQEIAIDSIHLDMLSYPYYFRSYAT